MPQGPAPQCWPVRALQGLEGDAVTLPEVRPVPGCPGYHASACGRIFSDRSGAMRELRQFDRRKLSGAPSPYLSVVASRDGKRCNRFVHELVLMAWVGPRPGSPDEIEACHGPGGSRDNRLSNLRWDTVQANADDKAIHREIWSDYADGSHAFSDLIGAE